MSATRSMRRLVGYRRGSFPRPLTIYAAHVEDVSLGFADCPRALTNSERYKQDTENGRKEAVESGSTRHADRTGVKTERRTETQVLRNTTPNAEGRGVNKLSGKSVEGERLAPQVGLEPTTLRLTAVGESCKYLCD
jgi:hypothetical protein